jgi:hypothetical protein
MKETKSAVVSFGFAARFLSENSQKHKEEKTFSKELF